MLEQECNTQPCPTVQKRTHAWGACIAEKSISTTLPLRHVREQETVCVHGPDQRLLDVAEACMDPMDFEDGLAAEYEVCRTLIENMCVSKSPSGLERESMVSRGEASSVCEREHSSPCYNHCKGQFPQLLTCRNVPRNVQTVPRQCSK